MSAEYSVEEVRARFEAWAGFYTGLAFDHDGSGNYVERPTRLAWLAYHAAYAERVKADEGAVPFGWVNFIGELSATKKNSDDTPVFTHPHSPDAADSGRVGDEAADDAASRAIDRVAEKFGIPAAHLNTNVREIDELRRELVRAGYALAAQGQGDNWQPMDTAPRDGTMLRLLVQFEDHATEDTTGPAPTIGAYEEGAESWQFAGWCWSHDHFTEGKGEPVGWLPMLSPASPAGVPDGWLPAESAPNDGTPHVRGLHVFSSTDGAYLYWDAVVGRIDTEDGQFYDLGGDMSSGWAADDFTHWHPLAAAPSAPEGGEVRL